MQTQQKTSADQCNATDHNEERDWGLDETLGVHHFYPLI
jgi:hypothetical protein